jgi:hypothetical protein
VVKREDCSGEEGDRLEEGVTARVRGRRRRSRRRRRKREEEE